MAERLHFRSSRYGFALLAVALAVLLRLLLIPTLGQRQPFVTYYLALLLITWIGGLGPSVLVLIGGAVGGAFLMALPVPPTDGMADWVALANYLVVGAAIIAFGQGQRAARRHLEREVAERLRAEEKTQEREATLRAFYENAPLCMGVVELTGDDIRHVHDNPATCRFFEVEPGSTTGRRASELGVPAEVILTWSRHYRDSLQTGKPVHFECPYDLPEGPQWLSATVCPIGPSPSGRYRYCYVAEDVTERKGLAEQLETERNLLDAFFASTPVGLGFVDSDFRFRRVNPAVAEITGLPVEAHIGQPVQELLPDLWPTLEPHYRKVLESGEPIRELHVEGQAARSPDGRRSWLVNCYPVRLGGEDLGVGFTVVETTEARLRESRLREAEERYRLATEAVNGMVYEHDPTTGRVERSSGMEAIVGYRPEEVEATAGWWTRRLEPGDLERVHEQYREALGRRAPTLESEYRVQHRDGRYRQVWDRSVLVYDEAGGLARVVGCTLDITERKRAEELLRASEEKYRFLAEGLPLLITTANPDGQLRYVNARFCEYLELTEQEVIAGGWRDGIHPDDLAETVERWATGLSSGEPFEIEYRLRRAGDGNHRWHVAKAMPIPGPDGRIVRWVTAALDIDDRKQAEERVRQAEERFRASQEASLYGFTILRSIRDGAGRIVDFEWEYVNPAAAALLKRPVESLVGRRLLDVLPGNRQSSSLFENYVRVAETGKPHDIELRYESEGIGGWFRNMTVKLGDGIAISFSDITERKRYEQELQQADRRKDEFLAMLAHELRNPLAPIRNAVSVMAMAEEDPETRRWAREVIDRQVRHLSDLVDDLLDVSRITQGKITLTKVPLAVSTFVGAAVESVRPRIDARGHRLEITLPEETLRVEGDPTRLSQVVLNLLNNAAKYTPEGGHIRLTVRSDGGQAEIRVWDNGIGIAPEMLLRIFELFTQASRAIDRTEGGLGIGLTLVRRLVEMHDGTVEARSDGPGQGSEFIVRLPLLAACASESRPNGQSRDTPGHPGRPRRILVVDDNRDSVDTLARLLQRLGHEVRTAGDGPTACALATGFMPDLVLLDIGLPGMDGYEVARRLRHEPALDGAQLVALTGYGSLSDRRESKAAGFDTHLIKPVEFEALRAVLERRQVAFPSQPGLD